MSEHPNATLARRMTEAMDAGDTATAASFLADDVVWHEIGRSEPRHGKAELATMMGEVDYTITATAHDIVANDDHTVLLADAVGTRNGRTLHYRVAEIYHIRDGKIVERWAFSDDTAAITDFFS
jgi:ketosteroid isomerase-like protein